jgi:hypothetical protein
MPTDVSETICFSEYLIDFQWTTLHYTPEDRTLQETEVTFECALGILITTDV